MEGRENPKASSNAIEFEQPWPVASLDEICAISSGITKGRKPPNEPLIEVSYMAVANVQDGNLNLDLVKTIQASASEIERYRLLPGDLLLTEGGDPDKLGRGTTWKDEIIPCIHQNHIFRVRANSPFVDMSFLSRLVASPVGKAYFLSKAKQTTGIASINLTQLRSFPVPLAPLNEQRRIAAKLDTTLAAVEACRQRLDGVAAILKRFRQAVLAAATSGELTREWREENADVNQWGTTTFGAECLYITVGFVGKMADQYVAHGVPFLRSLNVRPFRFDRENLAFISPAFHQSIIKSSLLPGDLAVVRTGAPGQCCVIPDELPEANCSDLVIARPGPRLIADFGAIVINSSLGQGFVKSEQVGVAQAHFNVGSMKRAPLYLPSIAEQKEIVRRAQELFTLADQLEARLTAARKVVDRLTPALLAKAFRGELVPQDPNDEPASVLLERIRAARQAEAAAYSPSRRGRPKAAASPASSPVVAAPVTPDRLASLLRECGALSERALLAASELDPASFQAQLAHERSLGAIGKVDDDGQGLLEAVG
jgi:type I restriction enzyme S subunit